MVVRALFAYDPPLKQFIHALKFQQGLHFADWFADKMIETWGKPEADCIVPVPLHPRRQCERGYNQTLEIAKRLHKISDIPLNRWDCQRSDYTLPQSHLHANERIHNIKPSSFVISSSLKNKSLLVIEDVITTGATIQAFIQALKKAGVKHVNVWACCQTLKKEALPSLIESGHTSV